MSEMNGNVVSSSLMRWRIPTLFVCVLLTACATAPQERQPLRYLNDKAAVTWPSLPEVPRYGHIGELIGEVNFRPESANQKRSWLEWITGLFSSRIVPQELQRPVSVYVDSSGRILVCDVSRQAVRLFDLEKREFLTWERAAKNSSFATPIAIAEDGAGNYLVTDADLGRVIVLSRDGTPVGEFGGGKLQRPTGIARDGATGLVYIADSKSHEIKIFNEGGELIDTFGGPGEELGHFNAPTHLFFRNGLLYVTDTLNARVQVLSTAGESLSSFGGRGIELGKLPHPKGIAADSEGNIYVIESYYDQLVVYNPAGELLLTIGGSGYGTGKFYSPAGLWIDSQDRVYIADMFNGRIAVMQYLGGN